MILDQLQHHHYSYLWMHLMKISLVVARKEFLFVFFFYGQNNKIKALTKALIKELKSVDLTLTGVLDNNLLIEALQNTSFIEDKRLYTDICALRKVIGRKLQI